MFIVFAADLKRGEKHDKKFFDALIPSKKVEIYLLIVIHVPLTIAICMTFDKNHALHMQNKHGNIGQKLLLVYKRCQFVSLLFSFSM